MHKHGSGEVAQPDPQDPQGVEVSAPQQGLQHEGAAEPTDEQRQRELVEENETADRSQEG